MEEYMYELTYMEKQMISDAASNGYDIIHIMVGEFDGWFRSMKLRELIKYMCGVVSDENVALSTYLGDPEVLLNVLPGVYSAIADTIYDESSKPFNWDVNILKKKVKSSEMLSSILSFLAVTSPTLGDMLDLPVKESMVYMTVLLLSMKKPARESLHHGTVNKKGQPKGPQVDEEIYRYVSDSKYPSV